MAEILKQISQITFGLMSPENIRKMSVIKIETPDTYGEDGYPIERGLMDPHLGVIDPSLKCKTCGSKGGECPGHFGSIELARPVIHVGFADTIFKISRSTCKVCGRILLPDSEIEKYTNIFMDLEKNGESLSVYIKEIYNKAKKIKESKKEYCPHCGSKQGIKLKFDKPNSIVEEVYKLVEAELAGDKFEAELVGGHSLGKLAESKLVKDELVGPKLVECKLDAKLVDSKLIEAELVENESVESKLFKGEIIKEDYKLTSSEIRERLEKVIESDARILGVNPKVARPEWMVLTVLPVPPVTVRPSITLQSGERSEDDLTHKLVDILRINQRLNENMEAGAPQLIVEDLWALLEYHVTTYFDNEATGVPPARHRSKRPLKTLTQRFKGKEGRFRTNLSGKRVNFSARTVISPDPNISINELGVPEIIAKKVTIPVHVNDWNMDEIKEYIQNGSDVHPGANYVIRPDSRKIRIYDETKEAILEKLEPGYIVERHLKDADIVLFNRQPSLHKLSMMAHEVKILPGKTFRLNLCVCPPYNADFDGDEMNMHVFQTDESRAEAKTLMFVQENIFSPRSGGPIIGAIHDHITGAYLLTKRNLTINEEHLFQIIEKAELPLPKRKNRNWNDKELAELLSVEHEGELFDLIPVEHEDRLFSLLSSEELIIKYKEIYPEIRKKCIFVDSIFNEDQAFQIIRQAKLPIPKRKDGSWTGKELFSLVLPEKLSMEYKAKICKKCPVCFDKECIYDAHVFIEGGKLVTGAIDEKAFGSFSGIILGKIVQDYGSVVGREFLDASTSLAISGVMKVGMTTSINDERIRPEVTEKINNYLKSVHEEVSNFTYKYRNVGSIKKSPSESSDDLKKLFAKSEDGLKKLPDELKKLFVESNDELKKLFIESSDELKKLSVESSDELNKLFIESSDELNKLFIESNDGLGKLSIESSDKINKLLSELGDKLKKLEAESKLMDRLNALGGNQEKILDIEITKILAEATDTVGEMAESDFEIDNQSRIMAITGARASMFNLTQISGTAGQQSVRGGRIYNGYIERPLPHFKRNDLGGKAHGFIDSNYFAGFDPIDFFFNAMGGREGLVDKGARTPRSGYTQRKLVNALLDISVKDNEMVTDNRGIIIQRVFGEDGVNPSKTEDGKIADLDKIIDEMRAK